MPTISRFFGIVIRMYHREHAPPIRDEGYFRRVGIDEFGVICWPNGADLAPDALHQDLAVKDHTPAAV